MNEATTTGRQRKLRIVAVAALLGIILATGCGGSGSKSTATVQPLVAEAPTVAQLPVGSWTGMVLAQDGRLVGTAEALVAASGEAWIKLGDNRAFQATFVEGVGQGQELVFGRQALDGGSRTGPVQLRLTSVQDGLRFAGTYLAGREKGTFQFDSQRPESLVPATSLALAGSYQGSVRSYGVSTPFSLSLSENGTCTGLGEADGARMEGTYAADASMAVVRFQFQVTPVAGRGPVRAMTGLAQVKKNPVTGVNTLDLVAQGDGGTACYHFAQERKNP